MSMGTEQTLSEAISNFDHGAASKVVEEAEQLRAKMLQRFPIEHWPEMTKDEYALGTDNFKDSFCYWMEYGTTPLGSIKGGASSKMIVYKGKDGSWRFNSRFDNVDDAWADLRDSFVTALEFAQAGKWKEIDDIEGIQNGPALCAKTMHLYFKNEVLPVYSRQHLRHFLRALERPEADDKTYDVIRLNRALLEELRKHSELHDWEPVEFYQLLYQWSDPRETNQIVKIAPGRDGELWDDCRDGGYICVGWDEVGDLRDFEDTSELRDAFAEQYAERYKQHEGTLTKKSKELWLLRNLEPGDKVLANRGMSHVLAVGEVVEPGYQYRPERSKYMHTVNVNWDTSVERDIDKQSNWFSATVQKLSPSKFNSIMQTDGKPPSIVVDPVHREISEALEHKGQVILYGPPGTGKTYQARRFAVWWLLKRMGREDADLVLGDDDAFQRAENELTNVQIRQKTWWVVANPKEWAWEQLFDDGSVDYRYGRLAKNYDLLQKGNLVVGYQSTPDKKVVALARVREVLHKDDDGKKKFTLEPVAQVSNGLTYEELSKDPILSQSEPFRFNNQGTLFALTDTESDHLISILMERDEQLSATLSKSDSMGPLTIMTFHASYAYEDFIEGFKPTQSGSDSLSLTMEDGIFKRVCREAGANPNQPYLILIDEINRANVAKVFGELITLLEKDKRGLQIALPQSKQTFTIPRNVFVLGTMNTADRSIKMLDAALRRRFAFIETMPDYTLLSGEKVGNLGLEDFLIELNRRVAEYEGREKQIGHAYLLNDGDPITEADEFARCFRQDILPLLQEYCYDEYGMLAKFIGKGIVNGDTQSLNEDVIADSDKLVQSLEKEFATDAKSD